MNRTLATMRRRIREELRAEGPDGSGYSDFFIDHVINAAQDDLAENFSTRDILTFDTTVGQNSYNLNSVFSDLRLCYIVRIEFNGKKVNGIQPDAYLNIETKQEGPVSKWFLWGDTLYFVGEVDEVEVVLWVVRAPVRLIDDTDVPELPYYTDEAIIQSAIAACYRESRDYERANFHFGIYRSLKSSLLRRGTPQGQRDHAPAMQDEYFGPVTDRSGIMRSDSNPGGDR